MKHWILFGTYGNWKDTIESRHQKSEYSPFWDRALPEKDDIVYIFAGAKKPKAARIFCRGKALGNRRDRIVAIEPSPVLNPPHSETKEVFDILNLEWLLSGSEITDLDLKQLAFPTEINVIHPEKRQGTRQVLLTSEQAAAISTLFERQLTT